MLYMNSTRGAFAALLKKNPEILRGFSETSRRLARGIFFGIPERSMHRVDGLDLPDVW